MKKINTKGIRFKTLIYFLIFSIIILSVLWLLQIVFLKTYYQGMKKREIERIGQNIVNDYGSENYRQEVIDVAFKNELSILVFRINGNMAEVLYSDERMGASISQLSQALSVFISQINGKNTVSYIDDEREGFETLTYGQLKNIDGEDIYFYINASLVPVESTTAILTNQLIIITIICLGLSVAVSFYLSRKISKPITEITNGATKLANNDFEVNFNAAGYDEIEKLSKTLNYATTELAKTDNLRKDLIANVSHELRTPLTLIKAYTELIRDISGQDQDKRLEHLSVILNESERLKNLVNDILDLSKLQSKTAGFKLTEFDLSKTLENISNNFIGIYKNEGYNFNLDIMPGCKITADESKIEQVIYNLLSNAINYSCVNKNITVALKEESENYRLDIIDSGIGIAKEDLPNVYDKFFKTGQAKRDKTGTGIGLFIVKTILEQHKFQFGVTSELNKGSDFYVIFPKNNKFMF